MASGRDPSFPTVQEPRAPSAADRPLQTDSFTDPWYLYLRNTRLLPPVQAYVSAFIQHVASVLEPTETARPRSVTFLTDRNGIVLHGFGEQTARLVYDFINKLDDEKVVLKFEVNLVLCESHRMTSNFQF